MASRPARAGYARRWPARAGLARAGLARAGLARFRLRVALGAILVVAAVGGCSTAPSGGGTTTVSTRNSEAQAYTLPLPPPPPTAKWQPYQVVLAFLHASATYDLDPAAAGQYLTATERKDWHPVSVTVVRAPTAAQFETVHSEPQIPQKPGQRVQAVDQVTFNGDKLATLSQSGQYQSRSGSAPYQFQLSQGANGVWLIDNILPDGVLLLTQSDFELVYQPRNLFFFAPPEPGVTDGGLVPDPVFAPIQVSDTALNTSLATGLVEGLIKDRSSWLSGGTWTAFPAGTTLIGGEVTISGPVGAATAVVNLGGAASQATSILKAEMLEQLQATFYDTSYSATPVATSVQLEIDGHSGYQESYQNLVTEVYLPVAGLSGEPWYAQTSGPSSVSQFGPGPAAVVQELTAGQVSQAPTALAVSTGAKPQLAVGVRDGTGCALAVGSLDSSVSVPERRYTSFPLAGSTGSCTSLSWAVDGTSASLWAVAGGRIWLLQLQAGPDGQLTGQQAVPVADPAWPGALADPQVLALRMAPDGVRAAFLVHTSSGNRLMLAAVSDNGVSFGPGVAGGIGLPDPLGLSWYDPYHLAVLAAGQVYDVPLTGSEGTVLGPAPADAVSLTTDSRLLLVGTSLGQVLSSAPTQVDWHPVAYGTNPIYPG